ncbi:MAG: hypothetical protein Q4G08_05955 [Capnocytophaga sp.]|nr:hypothetical protein [Capnocytophaga sp.]
MKLSDVFYYKDELTDSVIITALITCSNIANAFTTVFWHTKTILIGKTLYEKMSS